MQQKETLAAQLDDVVEQVRVDRAVGGELGVGVGLADDLPAADSSAVAGKSSGET